MLGGVSWLGICFVRNEVAAAAVKVLAVRALRQALVPSALVG